MLYAIRDAKNTHGGARVGTWKEMSASLANIPARFKTQFIFSEKDQKMIEQESEREGGKKSYIGADGYNEAAKGVLGGGTSTSSSPMQLTAAVQTREVG